MSIGIPNAIDLRGRSFNRWDIKTSVDEFHRPLRCAECSATVEPVVGYRTRTGTEVVPLFRLAKGCAHDEGCDYDFDEQAGALRRFHVGLIERDGDTYLLILNHLIETDAAPNGDRVGDPRSRTRFNSSRSKPLNQTLRAATEIARLIRKFDNDTDALDRFRAKFAGRAIAWQDFCFDSSIDLRRLHRELSRIRSGPDHPRAVVGRVAHRQISATGPSSIFLAVRSPESVFQGPVRTADGIPLAAVLRSRNSKRLVGEIGEIVVGYGVWKNFKSPTASKQYATLWLDDAEGAMCVMRP